MTDAFEAARGALAEASFRISAETRAIIVNFLRKDAHAYDGLRLRVGADLKPEGNGCDRQTLYRLVGAARDDTRLGDELRFWGGRMFEQTLVDALAHAGVAIETQVVCAPLRPSAWAWAPGHADILLTDRKHLLEIKAPRAGAFDRAKNDPTRLVRETYKFQLSHYFWTLKAEGRVETASWLFVDREGSHEPIEVPLAGNLLVPLARIVALETQKAALLEHALAVRGGTSPLVLPPRAPDSLEVEVLKGKARKVPVRTVRATEKRWALCSYCSFQGVCQPGPEEREVVLSPERQAAEIARAEQLWVKDPKAKAVFRYGPESEESTPEPMGLVVPGDSEVNSVAVEATDAAGEIPPPTAPAAPSPEATPSPLIPPDLFPQAAAGCSSLSDPAVEAKALVAATQVEDPCPTCEGTGASKGGGLACPDCLGTVPRPGFRPLGDGVRNPKLWEKTLAEVRGDESRTNGGTGW